MNSLIQGSAADLVKVATLRLEAALRGSQCSVSAHLVLHLHDELIYEVTPIHDLADNSAAIKDFCRLLCRELPAAGEPFNFSLPLPIKVKAGPTWSDLVPLD